VEITQVNRPDVDSIRREVAHRAKNRGAFMKTPAILVTLIALLAAGCGGQYTHPDHTGPPDMYSITLDKSFDQVWDDLIQHCARTFFAIDNYEKDSGLITLTFGSDTPGDYVTGGHLECRWFEGDYVDYLTEYYQADLDGRMNIVVIRKGPNRTLVKIHARYILKVPPTVDYKYVIWSFDTGGCEKQELPRGLQMAGTDESRTVCPTYWAETTIIEALK
jgi:hypothetical protein